MLPLSKIMVALNQNLVKTETSKAFTPLERQVIGMLHRLVFDRDDAFYARWMHDAAHPLGLFCSGGTIANISALWVARNRQLGARGDFEGVAHEGLHRALEHYGCRGAAVLVSERGHYSLNKAVDVLGLGRQDLVRIRTDAANRVDVRELRRVAGDLQARGIKVLAVVGIAGTTETGNIDPLRELALVCRELGCHFHVDAAWCGPTLMSRRHRHLLDGVELADSVTIDTHKQLYVPVGTGLLLLKDPHATESIQHHAHYIIRRGSKDLGATSLEGSRPGMAMLVHSALRIFGYQGYELLIDGGIERARTFARMIQERADFQLVTAPETNILTYRFVPEQVQRALPQLSAESYDRCHAALNELTVVLQKSQRALGKHFVSRTTLTPAAFGGRDTVVLRVVLANPLTETDMLSGVLDEQCELAQTDACRAVRAEIEKLLSR
jgi:glutamate decarboxylase